MKAIQKLALTLALALFFSTTAYAQTVIHGLKVGEKIPEVTLNHLLYKPGKELKLSQFKGKLIILDFWSTYCSSCIAAMPGMDSLQNEFADQVKIILVTKNKSADVAKLFRRIKMHLPHLDLETDDTNLSKIFPHQSEPHHVWIDQQGTYKYATFSYNATRKNIQQLLNGKNLTVSQKIDDLSFDRNKSLFEQKSSVHIGSNEGYSLIKKGLYKSVSKSMGPLKFLKDSSTNETIGFRGLNVTPLQLLQTAFCNEIYGFDIGYSIANNYRMLIEVSDPSKLHEPADKALIDDWCENNLLSYEVMVPKEKSEQLYSKMQSDFNFYLPVKGVIENRMVNCFVLIKTGGLDSLRSGETKQTTKVKDGKVILEGYPMQSFIKYLQFSNGNSKNSLAFVDQSGYNGKVSITLSLSLLSDIDVFNLEARKYGLQVVKKTLQLPMLVIKDNKAAH